jgi:hypothetical protein
MPELWTGIVIMPDSATNRFFTGTYLEYRTHLFRRVDFWV